MVKTTWRFLITWLVNHLYSSSCVSSIRPSFWAPSLHWVIRVAYSSPSNRPGTYKEESTSGSRTQIYMPQKTKRQQYHLVLNELKIQMAVTSPLASSVFILSRKPESSTLDSSMMKAIFSFLHPERRSTVRRSSSKSSPVYFLCTWNIDTHIQNWRNTATNVVIWPKKYSYVEPTLIWYTLSPFIHATKRDRVVFPAPLTPINRRWPWGWRKILEEDIPFKKCTPKQLFKTLN